MSNVNNIRVIRYLLSNIAPLISPKATKLVWDKCLPWTVVLVIIVVVEAWLLELARGSPQNSAWLLYLEGVIALPTARNSNEVARARW